MILTCPSCGTQYVVKDGAIPPEGRQVRCAACKHSWHQDAEQTASTEPEAAVAPPVEDRVPGFTEPGPAVTEAELDSNGDESLIEATLIEPRSGPEAEQRAYEEAAIDEQAAEPVTAPEPASTYANAPFDLGSREPDPETPRWQRPRYSESEGDEFSPFPAVDEDEPRRRSPIVPIMIVVMVVIVLVALLWFLAPADLRAKLGITAGATPLALVTTHMDRQRLASGNELLTVAGRVINPTGSDQSVPPLQAQLKSHGGKVVYSWTIAPPARTLAAGGTASFNSAEVNVPPGGDELTITLGSGAS